MNTQDPYSFLEEILDLVDISDKGVYECSGGHKLENIGEAKQRLISEFERVKREARIKEIEFAWNSTDLDVKRRLDQLLKEQNT